MSKIKLEIKRFKIPIKRIALPKKNKRSVQTYKIEYEEVDMKDHYKDSEEVEIDDISELNDKSLKVAEYNSRQLNFASRDATISNVFKKVVCKPKQK